MARPKKAAGVFPLTCTCAQCKKRFTVEVPLNVKEYIAPDLCDDCVANPQEAKAEVPVEGKAVEKRSDRPPGCDWCRNDLDMEEVKKGVCVGCKKRIANCAYCSKDKVGPEVCPKCIKKGARTCSWCFKPPRKNGSDCEDCARAFSGNNAGNYQTNEAPPTPGADTRSGGPLQISQQARASLAASGIDL